MAFPRRASISAPAIQRLTHLHIDGVGPAPALALELAPRLNLVTGDNSAGKTLVFDVVWWALTDTWPAHPAWPHGRDGERKPFIAIDAEAAARARFDLEAEGWQRPDSWPQMRAPVVYARADGGFSVWDEKRSGPHASPAIHFSATEVLDGKRQEQRGRDGTYGSVCEGLIADWPFWKSNEPDRFARFVAVLEALAPPGEELRPGRVDSLGVSNIRRYPHLHLPYGEVPLIHLSAAVRRVLSLAYLMVWTWEQHRTAADRLGEEPATGLVILVDEVENHLHPRWQRGLLPALFTAVQALDDDGQSAIDAQVLVSTHAPLVLASVETLFDEEKDRLFRFSMQADSAVVEETPWAKQGNIANGLVSETFGLTQARSREVERSL